MHNRQVTVKLAQKHRIPFRDLAVSTPFFPQRLSQIHGDRYIVPINQLERNSKSWFCRGFCLFRCFNCQKFPLWLCGKAREQTITPKKKSRKQKFLHGKTIVPENKLKNEGIRQMKSCFFWHSYHASKLIKWLIFLKNGFKYLEAESFLGFQLWTAVLQIANTYLPNAWG